LAFFIDRFSILDCLVAGVVLGVKWFFPGLDAIEDETEET
jgi:hypothetical protein